MAHTKETQHCIDVCNDCHDVCVETIAHCLQKGGKHAEPNHVLLLTDCAEICRTTADFMLRGSKLYRGTCALCAEVCDKCAASCEQFGADAEMKRCAEVCRRCAESCRQMSGQKAA